MEPSQAFDKIEGNIYREYNLDGGMEIALGYIFLCVALSIAVWPGVLWPQWLIVVILSAPVFFLAKFWRRRIVFPRLGYVQIITKPPSLFVSRVRKNMLIRGFFLVLLFNLVFHFAWKLPMRIAHLPRTSDTFWPPFENGEFIPFMSACFMVWGISGAKFSWIVVSLALCFIILSSVFRINVGWAICLTGLLLLGVGIQHLRRFLRENPRLEEADAQ